MKLTGQMKLELLSLNIPKDQIIVVDTKQRILALYENEKLVTTFPVSTAKAGKGGLEGSLKTPYGIHTIVEKIGADQPLGTIFESREPTGETWEVGDDRENLILTRILRLAGTVVGINKGPRVDSYDRYIYIHGTNREDAIGREDVSHGCILMTNADMVELFELVKEQCVVIIN